MTDVSARDLGRSLRALLDGFAERGTVERDRIAPPRPPKDDGGQTAPFPSAGIDGFLSHFVFTFRVNKGERRGQLFSYTWPVAIQTVARSEPFVYEGREANHAVEFPLPERSDLPRRVSESDFLTSPPGFFERGKETIFLQILNLDARGETPYGPMRCILGETFKREYPDIFQPSFGAAQSLGASGLPGRLFFVPNGIFETPFGALHTRPKNLLASHITSVPPVGGSPTLLEPIPLDSVEELRSNPGVVPAESQATLLGLAHPIDAALFGDAELFAGIEESISRTT